MRIGRLAVLLAVTAGVGPVSAATLVSVKTWGGPASERVEGTAVAADGSVYVAGTTFSFGAGNNDIFVLKYDAAGVLAWQRTWGQPGQFLGDSAGDVAVGADGSVYVVGSTFTTSTDAVLLKFDPSGVLLWQRTWGGPSLDTGDAIAAGPDGGVYIAGTTQSFSDREAFVVKFDADGALAWQRTWSRGDSDSAQALAVGPDGSVSMAGTSLRPESLFVFDAVLVRFAPDGSVISETAYGAGETADALGVAVAADGAVMLVGSLDGAADAFYVKLTPGLEIDFQKTLGGRSGDRANAVAFAADGTAWIAGETNTADASDEAFLVRVNEKGRVVDADTWGGLEIEHGIDVAFAPGGDLVVGAIAQSPPWTFQRSRIKSGSLRGALVPVAGATTSVTGMVGVPGGVVTTPAGSETFAGASDAAVLAITP